MWVGVGVCVIYKGGLVLDGGEGLWEEGGCGMGDLYLGEERENESKEG